MELKFRKLHMSAVLPQHSKPGDAGLDLTVTMIIDQGEKVKHNYGLAVEIPEGYVGLLFPRSSIHKNVERLSNSVGVIDSGYRGEIMAVFDVNPENIFDDLYTEGQRSAQLIVVPYATCETVWADELSQTERGSGGYGSTGK